MDEEFFSAYREIIQESLLPVTRFPIIAGLFYAAINRWNSEFLNTNPISIRISNFDLISNLINTTCDNINLTSNKNYRLRAYRKYFTINYLPNNKMVFTIKPEYQGKLYPIYQKIYFFKYNRF